MRQFLSSKTNSNSPIPRIKYSIEDLLNVLKHELEDSTFKAKGYEHLLNTNDVQTSHGVLNWEEYNFEHKPSIVFMDVLSHWQYRIRLVQKDAMLHLLNSNQQSKL